MLALGSLINNDWSNNKGVNGIGVDVPHHFLPEFGLAPKVTSLSDKVYPIDCSSLSPTGNIITRTNCATLCCVETKTVIYCSLRYPTGNIFHRTRSCIIKIISVSAIQTVSDQFW